MVLPLLLRQNVQSPVEAGGVVRGKAAGRGVPLCRGLGLASWSGSCFPIWVVMRVFSRCRMCFSGRPLLPVGVRTTPEGVDLPGFQQWVIGSGIG